MKNQFNLNTILLGVIGFFLVRAVSQLDTLATKQNTLTERLARVEAIVATISRNNPAGGQ